MTRLLSHRLLVTVAAVATLAVTSATFAQSPKRATTSAKKIDAALEEAHTKYKGLKEGKNADYIPVLAEVDPNLYGISLVTTNGEIHKVGDVGHEFSIQSISKVFTMALVLEESGAEKIVDSVGVDATGQAFNSIVAIEQYKGEEMNPLVNAGAIATTALVEGSDYDAVWKKIIDIHSDFAGRPLHVDQKVYESEAATNERNRAIAMLMHAYDRFEDDPIEATDLYTRQCSIAVNATDLATMAATLANGGVNPITKKQVISPEHVSEILAVMATAGLYDDTGQWLFVTGLPAKSGVGGGLIAVAPGKFGIAAFSPPLDEAGNSVRAQKAIMDIAKSLDANPYSTEPRTTARR